MIWHSCRDRACPNSGVNSGAVMKSPPGPNFAAAAAVVSEARLVERCLHESCGTRSSHPR